MRAGVSHCLLIILVYILVQAVVDSASTRSKIVITNSPTDIENCTREGDVVICPCNITINGTFYPCWIPLNNASFHTCFKCPLGTYSNSLSSPDCTRDCPAGSCLEPFKCDLCNIGYYANQTGSIQCTQCDPGYVAKYQGSQNCSACYAGSHSSSDSTDCIKCPPGFFSSQPASPKCAPCGTGEYSKEASTGCQKCGQGSYNSVQGSPGCTPCGVGYYGPNMGESIKEKACIICPAGSYCPEATTPIPVTCPRDYFCTVGAATPQPCPAFHQTKPGQESCTPSMGLYLLIFGCVGLAVVTVVVVWRWMVTKRKRQEVQQHKQMEIDRLIPKPRDGPVYSGL